MLGGTKDVFSGLGEISSFLRMSERKLSEYLTSGQIKINKLAGTYTVHREQLFKIIENGVQEVKVKDEVKEG